MATINIFFTFNITTTMPFTITTTLTIPIIIINITRIIISITIVILFFIITTIIISISTSIISTTIITKFLILPPSSSASPPASLVPPLSPNFSSSPSSSLVSPSSLSLSSPASSSLSQSSLLKSPLPPSPLFNADLIKWDFFYFNCKSLCSFIKYLLLYVNGFLKMLFSLIELSRFVFPGIFVTVCLPLMLLLPKQIILKQKKLAKQRKYKNCRKAYPSFYILCHSLFKICLILLFKKIKQAKETRMSYNNVKNTILFLITILEIQDSTRNSFLRYQLSYFALANIRLHRYDSFFRVFFFFLFILLFSGDINVSPGPTTITNNGIHLNTLPFHNCGEPTIPSECNSFGCYKAHDNSKWKNFFEKGLAYFTSEYQQPTT